MFSEPLRISSSQTALGNCSMMMMMIVLYVALLKLFMKSDFSGRSLEMLCVDWQSIKTYIFPCFIYSLAFVSLYGVLFIFILHILFVFFKETLFVYHVYFTYHPQLLSHIYRTIETHTMEWKSKKSVTWSRALCVLSNVHMELLASAKHYSLPCQYQFT